jgi:hypothetical protein
MSRRLLLALAVLALAHAAEAALSWREKTVELAAAPLDEKAEAVWFFTNAGTSTVTIVSIHSTCGCTVPQIAKRSYAPGETGEIRAVFTFQNREGRQEKTISVATDEPPGAVYPLVLVVDIPRLFEVGSKIAVWPLGSAPAPKVFEIRVLRPEAAEPATVEARDARFTATLERDAERPGVFRVVVVPNDTSLPVQTAIVVHTAPPAGPARAAGMPVITFYALIRESGGAPR